MMTELEDLNERLIEEIRHGNLSLVKSLIIRGADPYNRKDSHGWSAFMVTALYTHRPQQREILKYMIQHVPGFDKTRAAEIVFMIIDSSGNHDNAEIVRLLVAKGLDLTVKDSDGLTPLELARRNKRTETVKVLEAAEATRAEKRKQTLYAAVTLTRDLRTKNIFKKRTL